MPQIRVRIAPSPTGSPHVGTAYIALFNYAFAKSQQGKFLLRIEDTDQTRSHPAYEAAILNALRWVGIKWDEGPDIGGPFAPYRQSERTEIYRQHAEKLLHKDGAYRCFCSEERLEKMREDQIKRGVDPKYDGKCRTLGDSMVAKKLKDKEPFVVRLKVPKRGKCVIEDRLRGSVSCEYKDIDDQVLIKSDNFPTYHMANVIDDHLMEITHVIRGEEWLSSTPKHILLYEFFGWDKPEFIHMPLLLNPDRTKLSKRRNPTSIFYYRDAGFLPEALLNYLGMMGYSRPNAQEKFNLEEMISDFDINRIALGGSVFDIQKLKWLNGKYIRENYNPETLLKRMEAWRFNPQFIGQVVPLMMERMETMGDFMSRCSFFWSGDLEYSADSLIPKKRNGEETLKVLQSYLLELDREPEWNTAMIETKLRETAQLWDWKIREVTAPLFVAITGRTVAPPLFQSMELLGANICRYRIVQAIEKLGGMSKDKLSEIEKEIRERRAKLQQTTAKPQDPNAPAAPAPNGSSPASPAPVPPTTPKVDDVPPTLPGTNQPNA